MNHLNTLEREAIHIFREVAWQFTKPVILFSGGKDSTVLVHLARKAFYPIGMPFSLLHIDTGHNFPEALSFRDKLVKQFNLKLTINSVQEAITAGTVVDVGGKIPSRNVLQSHTLMKAILTNGFDACIGGGRRDEEKARAKERIFSIRDKNGGWQPYNQRPELWNIYNGMIHEGENVRVFPISNWSELDVWQYVLREDIELPSLYYAHERQCIRYNGKLLAVSEYINIDDTDKIITANVRYRTVGDMTCTAAIESTAKTNEGVIEEIINATVSERGQTRLDDNISDAGMEDRKMKGYF